VPDLTDDLPDALRRVQTRPLFVMRLAVRPLQMIGGAPGAFRRVGPVFGGSFAGERLSGEVLDGGADWQVVRGDGATTLDVRLVLRTRDDALIGMAYRGIRQGAPGYHRADREGRSGRSRLLFQRENRVGERKRLRVLGRLGAEMDGQRGVGARLVRGRRP